MFDKDKKSDVPVEDTEAPLFYEEVVVADEAAVDEDSPYDSPPAEEVKMVADVALEVLAGKWGSGQDRRLRLSQAGFNPNEVQTEVVRLLNK